jgi:hypothetical protein
VTARNGDPIPPPPLIPTATLVARCVANLVIVGTAATCFGVWQESAAAGVAFGVALWAVAVMRGGGR